MKNLSRTLSILITILSLIQQPLQTAQQPTNELSDSSKTVITGGALLFCELTKEAWSDNHNNSDSIPSNNIATKGIEVDSKDEDEDCATATLLSIAGDSLEDQDAILESIKTDNIYVGRNRDQQHPNQGQQVIETKEVDELMMKLTETFFKEVVRINKTYKENVKHADDRAKENLTKERKEKIQKIINNMEKAHPNIRNYTPFINIKKQTNTIIGETDLSKHDDANNSQANDNDNKEEENFIAMQIEEIQNSQNLLHNYNAIIANDGQDTEIDEQLLVKKDDELARELAKQEGW